MSEYRYVLEKGNRKHVCPECGKKRLVRFIDSSTGEYLPGDYGRCDREINCGYFRKPDTTVRQYKKVPQSFNRVTSPRKTNTIKATAYIPFDVLQQSRKGYDANTFVLYLLRLFGAAITEALIKAYQIGTSCSRWPGASIFWFIDINGKVRAGQVKHFDNTGHTAKYVTNDGEKRSCTTWIHSILKHNHEIKREELPPWLTAYLAQGGNYASCLYGEHLLKQDSIKPVAIVEAPATAIVASIYLPAFIWLAAGSLSYLTVDRCQVLSGRTVYLFPDISKDGKAYALWKRKAKELSTIATFTVSDLLEKYTTIDEKIQGLDIRDYLTRFDYKLFQQEGLQTFNNHVDKYIITIDNREYEIIGLATISALGSQFNNYTIATFMLTKVDFCDILFDAAGEIAKVNDDFSELIYARIGKAFRQGWLNGVECLLHNLTKPNI